MKLAEKIIVQLRERNAVREKNETELRKRLIEIAEWLELSGFEQIIYSSECVNFSVCVDPTKPNVRFRIHHVHNAPGCFCHIRFSSAENEYILAEVVPSFAMLGETIEKLVDKIK